MKDLIERAVYSENEQDLIEYLDFNNRKKINPDQYEMIEKALTARWHSRHEDLVNTIYLGNLKDDRFVEPILNIAINKELFRWYDDELEATLRKCVHALNTINSERSIQALKRLEDMNNENVTIALQMYK